MDHAHIRAAGRNLADARRDNRPHDHLVHLGAHHLSAVEHLADDHGTELRRREGGEAAAQLAKRCAGGRNQHNVLHDFILGALAERQNLAPYTCLSGVDASPLRAA